MRLKAAGTVVSYPSVSPGHTRLHLVITLRRAPQIFVFFPRQKSTMKFCTPLSPLALVLHVAIGGGRRMALAFAPAAPRCATPRAHTVRVEMSTHSGCWGPAATVMAGWALAGQVAMASLMPIAPVPQEHYGKAIASKRARTCGGGMFTPHWTQTHAPHRVWVPFAGVISSSSSCHFGSNDRCVAPTSKLCLT